MNYNEFLNNKKSLIKSVGFEITKDIVNPMLFEFQNDIVVWAVKKGRCAVFADTGLGKTLIQLEWGRIIGGKGLIFAPLSVARQTIREGKKINVNVTYIRNQSELTEGINITNYENIENFNDCKLDFIILDESSILKSIDGATRRKLIKYFILPASGESPNPVFSQLVSKFSYVFPKDPPVPPGLNS